MVLLTVDGESWRLKEKKELERTWLKNRGKWCTLGCVCMQIWLAQSTWF